MSNVAATTDATFRVDVLESDLPVLVDFWAPWCGPCLQLGPVIDQIGNELGGKLKVLKVNVDENMQISQNYGIRSIPTLMLFAKGELRGQLVGAMPKSHLLQQIESVLGVKA